MANGSNILREFLIALGFDVDEAKYQAFESKLRNVTDQFEKYGKVAAVAGTAISAALVKTASDMEKLYFSSQRAGTSVSNLMGLRFAAEQIGVGAEAAQAGVQQLGSTLRGNPGIAAFFQQFVGRRLADNTENFINLITKLQSISAQGPFGHAMATQIAAQFGIDEQTLLLYEKNLPDLIRQQERFKQVSRLSGVDLNVQSAQFHKFMEDVRTLWTTLQLIGIAGFGRLLPDADRLVLTLQKGAEWLLSINQATHGWATALAVIATTLGGIVGSFAILRSFLSLFGIGGAAAAARGAAGVAAGGAGTAAGGIGLGGLALAIGDVALAAYDATQASKLYGAYFGGAHSAGGDFLSSLLQKEEGFRSRIYPDVAGKPTIGFGHQVRPGEDFSGGITRQGALQLLAQDTGSTMQAVRDLVRVKLNDNQLAALTDLAFNIGTGAFARSTLLKDVNAGDFSGAAGEFTKWSNAGGAFNQDLMNRRLGEKTLFQKPDVKISQENHITVTGSSDPDETSRQVAGEQKRLNGDLVRNFAGAVQ